MAIYQELNKEELIMLKDPVCGMPVEESSNFHSEYGGKNFYFCSSACKEKFDGEPEKYLGMAKEGAASDSDVPASPHAGIPLDKLKLETTQIQIPIVNMDCANCAVTIEKQIKQLDGVKKVNVQHDTLLCL